MKIGFTGLGTMGGPMVRHLIVAGHDVTVHEARSEAAVKHLSLGGRWVDGPSACAAEAPAPGSLWIDMSTSTPAPVRLYETWAGRDFRLSVPVAPVS
jgi:3-hydroxyisobutyrate dehydrogenase